MVSKIDQTMTMMTSICKIGMKMIYETLQTRYHEYKFYYNNVHTKTIELVASFQMNHNNLN